MDGGSVKRLAASLTALIGVLVLAPGLNAYLKIGFDIGGTVVGIRWPSGVRYFVSNRDVPGVPASELGGAIARAFSTWTNTGSSAIASEFAGFVSTEPGLDDGASVIGFVPLDEDTVLGQTSFMVDEMTGDIVESDIVLNSNFLWSTALGGATGRHDVESIVLHEVGHLLGLGHSALGETELLDTDRRRLIGKGAVMFPIAFPPGNVADRVLATDDVAGVSDIYPTPGLNRETGSVVGRVRSSGRGVFGAHVVAHNISTGTLNATFSLSSEGDFVLSGLAPGLYVIRVEPLDDASIDSFFETDAAVDADFRATFAPQLAVVPAGGRGETIDVEVLPK
jgi:hypothetical protein